jgi:hypothetical protein
MYALNFIQYRLGYILGDFWRSLGDFLQKHLATLPTNNMTGRPLKENQDLAYQSWRRTDAEMRSAHQ